MTTNALLHIKQVKRILPSAHSLILLAVVNLNVPLLLLLLPNLHKQNAMLSCLTTAQYGDGQK